MWINLLGFKFIWLGLVFLGDVFIPIALILLLLHLCYCCNKKAEFQLVIWVTAIGIIIDSLLIFVGFFNFEHAAHLPYWLLALWVCFAATVSQGMSFLKGKVLWQILIGALFAPISYLTGANLSLINFEYSTVASFLVLGLVTKNYLSKSNSSLVFCSINKMSPLDSTFNLTTGSVLDLRKLKRQLSNSSPIPSV